MVAVSGFQKMLISSPSTSSNDACQQSNYNSKSRKSIVDTLSTPRIVDKGIRPFGLPYSENGYVCGGRKPRSQSVDFKTLETRRERLSIEGISCKAIKSAVKHLYCLEDFDIDKEHIGRGFYALVYRVTHKVTKQEMVLKMNHMSSIREALLEIQTLNEIQHPNLLKFYGVCVHGGKLWCLTEYVKGGSLDGLIGRQRICLSWAQRVKMARDIAEGMKYLHSKLICHRDLTSKNILYRDENGDGNYSCTVADFGLALSMKKHANKFETGYMATPYWMAPECLRGKPYSEKADVFSYGIVLCEIIARIPADPSFLPRTNDFALDCDAFKKILPAGCPDKLFKLASQCGDVNPVTRPSFIQVVSTLHEVLYEVVDSAQSSPSHNRCSAAFNNNKYDVKSCIDDCFISSTSLSNSLPIPTRYPTCLDPRRRLVSATEEDISRDLGLPHRLSTLRRSSIASSGLDSVFRPNKQYLPISSHRIQPSQIIEDSEEESHPRQRHSVYYLDFTNGETAVNQNFRVRRTRSLPESLQVLCS